MGQCLVFPANQEQASDRAAVLRTLRSEIGAAEALRSVRHGMAPLGFGDSILDSALPWGGLPQAALHEINGTAAAMGFTAALASRLASPKPILWCRSSNRFYRSQKETRLALGNGRRAAQRTASSCDR